MVTRVYVHVRDPDDYEPPEGAKVVRGTVFREYAELVLLLTDPPVVKAELDHSEREAAACVWGT
jgi:hypothetical protein